MKAELLTLRLIHIFGGIFWVGSMFFTTFFLAPALRSSPAVTGQVMASLQKRRLFTVLPTVALITIASGIRLLYLASAGFSDSYLSTATGRAFSVGAGAAIVAFLLAILVSRPGFVRVGQLAATLSTLTDESEKQRATVEMQRLSGRVGIANSIVVLMLVIAAAGMAVARYL